MRSNEQFQNMRSEIKELLQTHQHLFNKFVSYDRIRNFEDHIKVFYIADFLEKYEENQLVLDKDDLELREVLKDYYKAIVNFSSENEDLSKILCSVILEKILDHMNAKIVGVNEYTNIVLFAAHDTTMGGLLKVLGEDVKNYTLHYDDEITFLLEQNEADNESKSEYTIRIKYNDEFIVPQFIRELGVQEKIRYSEFKSFILANTMRRGEMLDYCSSRGYHDDL